MSPAVFPAILSHACKTGQLDFVDTMVSAYRQESEDEAKNLLKGLAAGLIMEGHEEMASHLMEYCEAKQIPLRMNEVYEFILENIEVFDSDPAALDRFIQSEAFQQIPPSLIHQALQRSAARGSQLFICSLIQNHPDLKSLSLSELLMALNQCSEMNITLYLPTIVVIAAFDGDAGIVARTAGRSGCTNILMNRHEFTEEQFGDAIYAALNNPHLSDDKKKEVLDVALSHRLFRGVTPEHLISYLRCAARDNKPFIIEKLATHPRFAQLHSADLEEEVLQVAIERGHTETVSALLRTNRLSLPSVQRAISAAADEPEIADMLTRYRNNYILRYGAYAVLGMVASYWAYLTCTGGES